MRRHLLALGASAICLALAPTLALGAQDNSAVASGSAANANTTSQSAAGGSASQEAITAQLLPIAAAPALAPQAAPLNVNLPVRVLSGGEDGEVSQSNTAAADAQATNANATSQEAAGGPGTQTSQRAATIQIVPAAIAPAISGQVAPVNLNAPVRVLSPGDDGPVSQSNTAAADADAANVNATDQSVGAHKGKDPKDPKGGGQVEQTAVTAQVVPIAAAPALAPQLLPANVNAPIRLGSPGDNGAVWQDNTADASGQAANANITDQKAKGAGAVSQTAITAQLVPIGLAPALAPQLLPANLNLPLRLLSAGDDPGADQSNTAAAEAVATNVNATTQAAWGGDASQLAKNLQLVPIGLAPALAPQLLPLNANAPLNLLNDLLPPPADPKGDPKKGADAVAGAALPALPLVGALPVDPLAVLANPLGTLTGALGNPVGTVTGLVGGLPLLGALPIDPLAALGDPAGLVFATLADPVGAVANTAGALPLPALPVDPLALLGDPAGLVLGAVSDPVGSVTGLVGTLPLPAIGIL
jgi:hypothetical protein